MESILTQLEKQEGCTVHSALSMFLYLLRGMLGFSYPSILKIQLKEEYDFIVVGAGTAGCIVASRLSENPNYSVLLVEAGGEEPEITKVPGIAENEALGNTSIDWHYRTAPDPEYCGGKPCYLPRAKVMGGCDAHNEMWYLTPSRKIYDEMKKRGIEGWSYEEMLPYYQRRIDAREIREDGSEVDMSIERFPYIDQNTNIIQQAYKEMNLPHPDSNGDTNQDYKTTSKKGARISVNELYLRKFRYKRPNLHVITQSFVTKLVIDPVTKIVTGVQICRTEGGKKEYVFVKARKEVLVCCGVINSPQLLQLSGIGPADLLKRLGIDVIKDSPAGKNFQNHASFTSTPVTLTSTSTIPRDCETIRKDMRNYISNKSGPFSGSGAYTSYLLLNSSQSTEDLPDVMVAFVPSITGMNLPDQGFLMVYYNKLSTRVMTTRPRSQGTVFCKSKNPFEYPEITLGHSYSETKSIIHGLAIVHKIVNTKIMKKHGFYANNTAEPRCKHIEYGSVKYWECAIKGHKQFWHHGMSTCSMGPKDDPVAVVDNKCKVYGIKGLRVIDASILPVVPNVNTNAMVMAAAEKCVQHVKMDYF